MLNSTQVLNYLKIVDSSLEQFLYKQAKKISRHASIKGVLLTEMTSENKHIAIRGDFQQRWIDRMVFKKTDFFIYKDELYTIMPYLGKKQTNIAIIKLNKIYQEMYTKEKIKH